MNGFYRCSKDPLWNTGVWKYEASLAKAVLRFSGTSSAADKKPYEEHEENRVAGKMGEDQSPHDRVCQHRSSTWNVGLRAGWGRDTRAGTQTPAETLTPATA